jgi:hypothetical protein
VAFLMTTIITISGPVQDLRHWWVYEHNWREREYEKLTALRAGFTLTKFEEVLGAPVFRQTTRRWAESSFQGRDYWVQAVWHRPTGVVHLYAVTSCSEAFTPTFVLPDGERIVLNRSTLASVRGGVLEGPATADYFAPGATANAHFIEFSYGGNPSNYKTHAWGYNDACLDLRDWYSYLPPTRPLPARLFGARYVGPTTGGGLELQAFRKRLPVNTYAETSPSVTLDQLRGRFQIGVDRLLIRTVSHPVPAEPFTNDPFGRTDQEYIPVRPASGAPALRRTWSCLHRTLVHGALPIFDRADLRESIRTWDVAALLPRKLRDPVFRAPGGFIFVSGLLVAAPTAARRATAFPVPSVLLAYYRNAGAAAASAQRLREETFFKPVELRGAVVVAWSRRPRPKEARAVMDCMD